MLIFLTSDIHPVAEAFKEGILLLGTDPVTAAEAPGPGSLPLAGRLMVLVFTVLAMLLLRNFLGVFPYLVRSFFRARGNAALEGSVRVSRDRNIMALVFIIPFCVLMYRYRLWAPSFLDYFIPDVKILLTASAFALCLVLRAALCHAFVPKRTNHDNYFLARKSAYNYFILLVVLQLVTVGILTLLQVSDEVTRVVLLAESAFIYMVLILRRGQILSASCNPLTTFSYLCALEILPTALFVLPAALL